jgi:ubiquinone/menaquinone biosynthesis C-methylase UbiE
MGDSLTQHQQLSTAEYRYLMDGLERSKFEKARIIPLIDHDSKNILEIGCGNGVVLSLLASNFSSSHIIGLDMDPVMCEASRARKLKNVSVIQGSATEIPLEDHSVDTVVFCSTLHEVYSHGGYECLVETLKNAYRVLIPGGNIIIRDSLKPPSGQVSISFKNDWVRKRFVRFLNEYEQCDSGMVSSSKESMTVDMPYCFEYLTKYFYEVGWEKELTEVYGYFTKEDFITELHRVGFNIEYEQAYLLKFLQDKWSSHFTLDRPWPLSTIIIKAGK